MCLNRISRINCLILVSGILIAVGGCTKSSLKELALFRGVKDVPAPEAVEAEDGKVAATFATVWHDSFETAKAASTKSGKPILAVFTGSDWCPPCKKLKESVFDGEEFKLWASQNVVQLELDFPNDSKQSAATKKQNAELAKKYNVRGYPTQLLLSSQGEVLGKLEYQKDPKAWIASADKVLSK